jgi:hypothetical protein
MTWTIADTERAAGIAPAFVAGHADYAWEGDPRAGGAPILLTEPRVVHAVLVEAPGPSSPWFQDYARTETEWRSLCGATILAVTTRFFDDGARRTCSRCAETLSRWLETPEQIRYERAVLTPFVR